MALQGSRHTGPGEAMGQGMRARLACPGGPVTWRGALNWGGGGPCPPVCCRSPKHCSSLPGSQRPAVLPRLLPHFHLSPPASYSPRQAASSPSKARQRRKALLIIGIFEIITLSLESALRLQTEQSSSARSSVV